MPSFIKNKTSFKVFVTSLVFSLIFSVLAPSLQTVTSANSNIKSKGDLITDSDNLEQVISDDHYSKDDLTEVKQFLYDNYGIETSTVLAPGEVEEAKAVSAILKGLKSLAPVFKHGGTVVGFLVKPFSKKYGTIVKRNSRKIGNALEKVESGTKSSLEKALRNAGVSPSDAKSIVKVLFWII